MPKFEVETDLIVHCRVKVTVEAVDKEDAIDAAAGVMPNNYDPEAARAWKAKVDLKPPKGVNIRFVKATHFEQASGADKARKISE